MQKDIHTKYRIFIHLSRGCIPIPTSFVLRYNFEQEASFIRSLRILYLWRLGQPREITRKHEASHEQPIKQSRTIAISQLEGSLLRSELFESSSLLNQLKKFPIYLLDTWNQRIRQILGTVIGSLPPLTSNILCHLFQLQQVDIVLQNANFTPRKVKSLSG